MIEQGKVSPPEVIGLANGIAQSIVSLARFLGPVIGGYVSDFSFYQSFRSFAIKLWSVSVAGSPNGYPLGFLIVSVVTALAVAQSFLIR